MITARNLRGDALHAYLKTPTVQLPVMKTAQRDKVLQTGLSALRPVLYMMRIHIP